MDRVLLKRLLGAGVIVALAVIVLPFVLQGEGYKAALRTEIPVRPQPPQPLETASREPPPEVRELMTPPSPLPVPAPRVEAPKAALAEATSPPALPPSPRPAGAETKTAPLPPAAKPSAETGRPEVSSAPPAKVATATQPPAAASKPSAAGAWMIQLGSFSAEANAQQLRAQVQRVGLPCLIEPLDIEGRKVWRVRAGPFASQAEAEAALKRLQGGLKLGGMVMQVR